MVVQGSPKPLAWVRFLPPLPLDSHFASQKVHSWSTVLKHLWPFYFRIECPERSRGTWYKYAVFLLKLRVSNVLSETEINLGEIERQKNEILFILFFCKLKINRALSLTKWLFCIILATSNKLRPKNGPNSNLLCHCVTQQKLGLHIFLWQKTTKLRLVLIH